MNFKYDKDMVYWNNYESYTLMPMTLNKYNIWLRPKIKSIIKSRSVLEVKTDMGYFLILNINLPEEKWLVRKVENIK